MLCSRMTGFILLCYVLNATEEANLPMKNGPKSIVKHRMQQYSSKEISNAAQAADQSHDLPSFLAIVRAL